MKNKIVFILLLLLTVSIYSQNSVRQDALVLYHNGNYRESVKVCEEELKDNPNRVESYVVMCWALVKNKQYAEAEQRAVQGLAISPYDLRLIEILGEAYIRQARNQHADISLSAAVKKEPLMEAWWIRLGYAREMAENNYEALQAYDEALKLNTSSIDASRGRERISARLQ